MKKFSKRRKLKIEALKNELNAVIWENFEFGNRFESRLSDYENLWRIQGQFYCRIKVDSVLTQIFS